MQNTMRLAAKGLATKKLVEEVKQAAMQSNAKVAVVQVELGDLRSKIEVIFE